MRRKLVFFFNFLFMVTLVLWPQLLLSAEKTLTVVLQKDIRATDPTKARSVYDLMILENIYEGLIRRDGNLRIKPALALSWTLIEPTRWRFFLREGVRFQNGSDFTVADVIHNFDRLKEKGAFQALFVAGIKEVVRIDNHTIDFISKEHNPAIFSGWHNWLLVNKKSRQHVNSLETDSTVETGNAKKPATAGLSNGTGPFVLVKRKPNIRTTLRRNKNWWDDAKHNLEIIHLDPLKGPDSRMKRLRSGKVDLVMGLPTTSIASLKGSKKFNLMQRTGLKTVFLFFDQGRDPLVGRTALNPFKDARVRQAMRLAIDFDGLTNTVLRKSAISMSGLVAPKLLTSQLSQIVRLHDPKRAKAFMADAGYRGGFQARLDCPSDQFRLAEAVCTAISENLRDAGIRLEMNMHTMSEYLPKIMRPEADYQMGILAWQTPTLDGWNVLNNLIGTWNPESKRGLFNLSRISNLRVDELIEKINIERDKQVRGAMIAEALQIVRDNNYYIPLYRERHLVGKRKNIKAKLRPDGAIMFRDLIKK